jgi:hypothetical protein
MFSKLISTILTYRKSVRYEAQKKNPLDEKVFFIFFCFRPAIITLHREYKKKLIVLLYTAHITRLVFLNLTLLNEKNRKNYSWNEKHFGKKNSQTVDDGKEWMEGWIMRMSLTGSKDIGK